MSVAVISSCLPSIFNLVKHFFREALPSMFSRSRTASRNKSGSGKSRISTLVQSLEDRDNSGFAKLGDTHNDQFSEDRLYIYTKAYVSDDWPPRRDDIEMGRQIPRVYVPTKREDIEAEFASWPYPHASPMRREDMGLDIPRQLAHIRRHSSTLRRGRESVFPIKPIRPQTATTSPEQPGTWTHSRMSSMCDPVMNWASTLGVGQAASKISRVSMDCSALSKLYNSNRQG
ncbi:hypothetical protein MMC13_001996 [Lambiella insularis]|nr:hypothetical protein [Lambiella insularis]